MACDKHQEYPVNGYYECPGCEVEILRAEVEKWKALAAANQKGWESCQTSRERKGRLTHNVELTGRGLDAK